MSSAPGPNRLRRRRQPAVCRVGVLALAAAAAVSQFVLTPPSDAARREVLFQQFSSCPRFLAYVQGLALPSVGPYGIGSGPSVVGPTPETGAPRPGTPRTRKKAASRAPAVTTAPAAAQETAAASAAAPATAAPAGQPAPAEAVSESPGFGDGSAAQANSSSTNTQEVNVDEGDLIENDGRYLYSAVGGSVRIVDVSTGTLVATIPGAPGAEPQLLLDGPRLAVIRQLFTQWPETTVERWDVSNPSSPRFESRVHLEGTFLAARTVNNRARIVLQTPFGARIRQVLPTGDSAQALSAATAANRAVVKRAKADEWLPRAYNSDQGGNPSALRQAVNCVEIGKPADTSGLSLTWVATIDLNVPSPRVTASGSGGVVGAGNIVYASEQSLFVATSGFNARLVPQPAVVREPGFGSGGGVAPRPVSSSRTLIHGFNLSGADGATYFASGSVDGRLLNQFSMSDFGGALRVAVTTDGEGFGSPQQSGVRVLQRNGRSLDQIGTLNGLGINERIYAVRFLGELGYIVTFRQVDPLYVIDLRNPRAPRRAGELKIPGYSSYLHPIAPGQLLGIGQDATDQGQRLGTVLQVFDVSDPNNPRQATKLRVGGSSEAEYDHRAFLWWAPSRNAVIPQSTFESGRQFFGALVAKVNPDAITVQGRVEHQLPFADGGPVPLPQPVAAPAPIVAPPGVAAPPILPPPPTTIVRPPTFQTDLIRRSAIVNGRLVTVSANAVKVTDLATVSPISFSSFLGR